MKPESIALKRATGDMIKGVGGLGEAAKFCRVGKSVLSDAQSVSKPECFAALDVVADLEPLARERSGWPHVTSALCIAMGGVFVAVPEAIASPADLFEALACLSKEASDTTASICRALADGTVTSIEARAALVEVDELIRAAASMRSLLLSIPEDQR